MPANALPPPMPCGVFEDCTLNNPCYSRVHDVSPVEPSTSVLAEQLSFVNDEFFEERYKDFTYKFYVENFPQCYEKYMESEPFDGGTGGDLKWRLRLYPRLLGEDGKEYIGVFLRLDECHRKRVLASFNLSWLSDDEEAVVFTETPRPCLFYKNKDLGYANFLERDVVLASMLQSREEDEEGSYYTEYAGSLHIACQVKIKSYSEVLNLKTMGRYTYECNGNNPYKQPLLYIM